MSYLFVQYGEIKSLFYENKHIVSYCIHIFYFKYCKLGYRLKRLVLFVKKHAD